jgi:CheY-like chemotaxis protein
MVEPESAKNRARVLVVDDESDLRKALEKSLRRLGYEVSVATNGEEGKDD